MNCKTPTDIFHGASHRISFQAFLHIALRNNVKSINLNWDQNITDNTTLVKQINEYLKKATRTQSVFLLYTELRNT